MLTWQADEATEQRAQLARLHPDDVPDVGR
jgi:hypothetical protein